MGKQKNDYYWSGGFEYGIKKDHVACGYSGPGKKEQQQIETSGNRETRWSNWMIGILKR